MTDPDPYSERRILGHYIAGLYLHSAEGVSSEGVFFVCDEMGSIPPEVLARVHAEGRAVPSLAACGRHDVE